MASTLAMVTTSAVRHPRIRRGCDQ